MKPTAAPCRSARIERTQQALVGSLLELIVEKGYDRTTVEDVLRRADVGRTAFYDHFENKQDLLLRRMSDVPWIRESSRHGGDAAGSFDVTVLFEHIADQRELVAALYGTPVFEQAVARLRDQLLASFTRLLQDRATNNENVDSYLQLTAQALTGALMQLFLWWLAADMPETPATMASWFAQLAERMVDDRQT